MANRIAVLIELDDDYADPDHEIGITDEGYQALCAANDSAVGEVREVRRWDSETL